VGGVVSGRTSALALLASCLACGAGCAPDDTALLIHVCIGLDVPRDVAFVKLVVDDPLRPERSRVFRLSAGASLVTWSVRPGAELAREEDLLLSVVGLSDTGEQRIARTVHTWFAPGADRDVAVSLAADCLDVACRGGETCGAGVCRPVGLATEERCPGEP
jgi:hypothetical protein